MKQRNTGKKKKQHTKRNKVRKKETHGIQTTLKVKVNEKCNVRDSSGGIAWELVSDATFEYQLVRMPLIAIVSYPARSRWELEKIELNFHFYCWNELRITQFCE